MQKSVRSLKLSELAERFNLRYHGDGEARIEGVGTLSGAGPAQISFLSNPAYRDQLQSTLPQLLSHRLNSITVRSAPCSPMTPTWATRKWPPCSIHANHLNPAYTPAPVSIPR